jgi:hypothetical protein
MAIQSMFEITLSVGSSLHLRSTTGHVSGILVYSFSHFFLVLLYLS